MNIKFFVITLFWKQNSYHQHGILVHTLRVTWEVIKAKKYRMVLAGLLHDIGKPGSAHQKDDDAILGYFSFTNHEEASFEIIKNWPFISDYTKNLVRYHYIIRRMAKTKEKDPIEYASQKAAWDKLTPEFQKEVAMFMKCDDLGKGSRAFTSTRR